jgi:hypothetical protein
MSALAKRESATAGDTQGDSRGDFFAIDRRAWHAACDLGLNAAVCYLLMARGTGPDNRTTRWSVHAVEGWSGISRPKARVAMDDLIANGLVENLNDSRTRPKRGLVAGHLLPQIASSHAQLTKGQEKVVAALPMQGRPAMAAETKAALTQLVRRGLVGFDGTHYVKVDLHSEEPDWIWLPNSLLDGAVDEAPPIENIRMAQDISILRLLVDLYHAHSLSFYGGIPTSLIRGEYHAEEIAHQREYRIWNVWETDRAVSRDAPFFQPFLREADGKIEAAGKLFWTAFETLQKLGYVHFIGHIFEGSGADAEIIHPFDFRRAPIVTEAESKVECAARRAATALLPEFLRPKYYQEGIVPVRDHIRAIEARGVARLLYRPRTVVTAQWKSLDGRWDRWTAQYENLIERLPPVEPL